ncbi:MAG: YncE family protein [Candidatus Solibacter sp.]
MKFLLCLLLSASAALAADGFRVIQKIHIGGGGAWDRLTLDETGRRLYVSNDTRVVVVDIDAGKVVGEIPGGAGIHGIAIAPELGRGFITNGGADTVTIFDLKTLKPIGQPVATGADPGPIVFEPKTGKVFAFNLSTEDKTATVIDAKTGEPAGQVLLGGKATAAVVDGTGKIWVALQITSEDWNVTSEVGVVDAEKLTLLRHNPIAPCDRPTDLALDAKNHRAFAVCGNAKMAVVDTESGKVLQTVTIGKLSSGVAVDPATGVAYSANGGDGTITVVAETGGKFEAAEQVPTSKGSRVLRIDSKTHKIFLPALEYAAGATAPTADSFMVLVVGK